MANLRAPLGLVSVVAGRSALLACRRCLLFGQTLSKLLMTHILRLFASVCALGICSCRLSVRFARLLSNENQQAAASTITSTSTSTSRPALGKPAGRPQICSVALRRECARRRPGRTRQRSSCAYVSGRRERVANVASAAGWTGAPNR